MKSYHIQVLVILIIPVITLAQTVSSSLPSRIEKSRQYLFYLHGGVVTVLGNNAINQSVPEWGPYEYLNILDSLRVRGFNVISENRKEEINDSVYVQRITNQIDSLFRAGVKPGKILVVGASAGWNIALYVAGKLKNRNMSYVIMGGCWPNTYKDYQEIELYGHFLSIIESTDPHGTCSKIFDNRKYLTSVQEITLNTGMSHGFFYKGYKHWIDPVVDWFNKRK